MRTPGTILCNGGTTLLNVSASGGSGSLEYSINNGGIYSTNSSFSVGAGSYDVVVRDDNGCTYVVGAVVVTEPAALSLSASATAVSCNGGLSTITASATGGTGVLTYTLDGTTSNTTGIFSGVSLGTHTVEVVDANTCSDETTVLVSEPTAIIASAVSGDILCNGGTTTITVSASGGTSPLSYSLDGGASQSSSIFMNVSAGSHEIRVSDANGCYTDILLDITEPSALSASANTGTILCNGGTTLLNVSASGGSGSLEYSINNGGIYSTNSSFSVGAGSYDVVVRDDNGCTYVVGAVVVTEPAALSLSASATAVSCNGGLSTITASATGGTGVLTYTLDGTTSNTTGIFSGVSLGTHTVEVVDANACSDDIVVLVSEPTAIIASAVSGVILCNGATTTITVSASGGTSPLSYSLDGGAPQSSSIFMNVSAGSHQIRVSDANGCYTDILLDITEPSALSARANTGTILCNGGTTLLNVSASGGSGSLEYSINNGGIYSTNSSFSVGAGSYDVVVRDSNGCTYVVGAVVVTEPALLSLSASATAVSCNGGTSTITASATGGTGVLTYTLDGTTSNTTGIFADITAGTHLVEVVDANSCSDQITVNITQNSDLAVDVVFSPIACNGGFSIVSIAATGGDGSYAYYLDGVVGSFVFSNVVAGTHTIQVQDGQGCTASQTINITEPSALNIISDVMPIACYGGSTTVTVSVSGGTGTLSITLDGVSGNGIFSGITAGTHSIVVTDENGCTTNATVDITEPIQLIASASAAAVSCNGGTTTIVVVASGGTGSYEYSLDGGTFQSSNSFANISAGTYTVEVRDVNGCLATDDIIITEPSALVASAVEGSVDCNGGTTTVTVSATGGTAPYSGTGTFTVSAGAYSYTVTDANGCTSTVSGTITQPSALVASAVEGSVDCNGGTTTVTVSATGGTAPYSGTGTFTVSAGAYSYTVTDANGCTSTISGTITQPSGVTASAISGTIACYGGTTTITASASGGTAPYQYSLDGGTYQLSNQFFGVEAANHVVTVQDANGCESADFNITVTEPALLTVDATVAATITCSQTTVQLTATPSAAVTSYSWVASNGGNIVSGANTATPLVNAAGTYAVTVTNANGCSDTDAVQVQASLAQPGAVADVNAQITCTNATVTLSGSSSTIGVTYSWTGPNGFTSAAQNPSVSVAGTYTLTVTNPTNGCSSTDAVTVTQDLTAPAAVIDGISEICEGETVTLSVDAAQDAEIVWSTGETTSSIAVQPTETTTYTVSVTAANGCVSEGEFTITVNENDGPLYFDIPDYCAGTPAPAPVGFGFEEGGIYWLDPAVNDGAYIDPVTGIIYNGVAGTTYGVSYDTPVPCQEGYHAFVNVLDCGQECANVVAGDLNDLVLCNLADGTPDLPTSGVITLTGGQAGGIWSISPQTAAFNPSTGIFNAAGMNAGVYMITYVVINPDLPGQVCPDAIATATVTVLNCTSGGGDECPLVTVDATPGNCQASGTNGSISGHIWYDNNQNQIQDANEANAANIMVELYNTATNTLVSVVATGNNGNYVFSNLPAGQYDVNIVSGAETTIDQTMSPVTIGSASSYDLQVVVNTDDITSGSFMVLLNGANSGIYNYSTTGTQTIITIPNLPAGAGSAVVQIVDNNGNSCSVSDTYMLPNNCQSGPVSVNLLTGLYEAVTPCIFTVVYTTECVDKINNAYTAYKVTITINGVANASYTIALPGNTTATVTADANGVAVYSSDQIYPLGITQFVVTENSEGCSQTLEVEESCTAVTALELLRFWGEVLEPGNELYWITATETNNDYFILERSVDGINFEAIGNIDAVGDSQVSSSYQFLDKQAPLGISYYRLRAVDIFGVNEIVSTIVALTRDKAAEGIVNVGPIPTHDQIFIDYISNQENTLEIRVVDVIGRVLQTLQVQASVGVNQWNIDMSAMSAGVYFIGIHDGTRAEQVVRVVKD
ncbi:MAG: T9SS type A sorting domain-containing protein [Sphingobacteriales bacterium]|nr:T9SS type A sorting domain-containing protein [Sphingobacteriales bacterium]